MGLEKPIWYRNRPAVSVGNHFLIAPHPGGHFDHAEVRYSSVFGKVESGWKRKDGKTVYTFLIPANCTATVILPGREVLELTAGDYQM